MALGKQLVPIVDYRKFNGTWSDFQTFDTEYIRYRYGADEDAQGNKISPIDSKKAYTAVQVRGGLQWYHDYPSGTLVDPRVSEMTATFKVDDRPNIWFYYETA